MVRHVCRRHSMAGVKSLGKAIRPALINTIKDRHGNMQEHTGGHDEMLFSIAQCLGI